MQLLSVSLRAFHLPGKSLEKWSKVKGSQGVFLAITVPERFELSKSFRSLSWKDDDDHAEGKVVAGSAKRPRLSTEATAIKAMKQRKIREKLRQFVVTLEIEADSFLTFHVSNTSTRAQHTV